MTALDLEESDYIEISAMTRQPSATTLASVRTKFQRPHERSKAWRAARISSGLPHVARSSWVFSGTFFAAVMMQVSNDPPAAVRMRVGGDGAFPQTLDAAPATPGMGAVTESLKTARYRIWRFIVGYARTSASSTPRRAPGT